MQKRLGLFEPRLPFSIIGTEMENLGKHVIAELYHCDFSDINSSTLKNILTTAAKEANATLLSVHTHSFPVPNCSDGLTGVAILAESHISIHTWSEYCYAAVDVFTCGDADPEKAVEYINKVFDATPKVRILNRPY